MSSGETDVRINPHTGEEITPKDYLRGRRSRREITGAPRKGDLTVGTIEPRNAIEQMFLDKFGTITPIPDPTRRRGQKAIMGCILYIHHGFSSGKAAKQVGMSPQHFNELKAEDKWDQFRVQLSQLAQPSSLALVEHHDIELIQQERQRRLEAVDKLVAEEERLLEALKKMVPGSLNHSGALASLEKIRKINAQAIGLDTHSAEQHAGRKAAITTAIGKIAEDGYAPNSKQAKGKILDIEM